MRHPAAVRSLRGRPAAARRAGASRPPRLRRRRAEAGGAPGAPASSPTSRRGSPSGASRAAAAPGSTADRIGWSMLASRLRRDCDYLRYLEPRYADASALRARAENNADIGVRRLARAAAVAGPSGCAVLRRTLELVERCLEPPPHVERFLADFAPDVVLVTHLARDSVQVDFVRAAKRLGVHTAYPVFSWDNLSNKGLVHEVPELVLVWNELQADEAVELQSLPRERVRVLGAWSYDHWFEWQPSRSREEFCADVGLRADRPIVLYVCSSSFVAPDEVAFVRRWIGELRRARGSARRGRRHRAPAPPQRVPVVGRRRSATRRRGLAAARRGAARGASPGGTTSTRSTTPLRSSGSTRAPRSRARSSAGPCTRVLADEFRETQQGTIHFHYLKADEFGHLYVGRTMAEHLAQLEESVRGREDDGRNERFLRRFVRPLGLDVAGDAPLRRHDRGARCPARTRTGRRSTVGPRSCGSRSGPSPTGARAGRSASASPRTAGRTSSGRRCAAWNGAARERRWSPGRGSGTRSASSSTGSRSCAGRRAATYGLRERLTVVSLRDRACWYAGIGSRRVDVEDAIPSDRLPAPADSFPAGDLEAVARGVGGEGSSFLDPGLVAQRRVELSGQDPDASFSRRRLEFAPLAPGDSPAGLQLPDRFVVIDRPGAAGPGSHGEPRRPRPPGPGGGARPVVGIRRSLGAGRRRRRAGRRPRRRHLRPRRQRPAADARRS